MDQNRSRLDIAVDALAIGEGIASDLTSKSATDTSRVPALIDELERPPGSFYADGACDTERVYTAVENYPEIVHEGCAYRRRRTLI